MQQSNNYQISQPNLSYMDWKGSKSRRFSGGKIHFYTNNNFFNGLVVTQTAREARGLKYIPMKYSDEINHRSCIRNFQYANQSKPYYRAQGLRITGFEPLPIKARAQRLHIQDRRASNEYHDLKIGIKTFERGNRASQKQYHVEDKMQRKVRVSKLDSKTFYGNIGSFRNQNGSSVKNKINDYNYAIVSNQDQKMVRDLDRFNPKNK